MPQGRPRLRELGYRVGRIPAGELNAITDVPGVRVGHVTLLEGDSVRTGVTAVLPHDGNLYAEKVLAGAHVLNGYGKPAGLTQLAELGTLESPILLTNTLSVGPVWEGGLRHLLGQNPTAALDRDTVNVLVMECFDGYLSDARGLHVRAEHALEAIASASPDEVREGSVGAGTGTGCFGYKAGVGTASRRGTQEPGHVLGVLAVTNFGARRELPLLVGLGEDAEEGPDSSAGGSAVVAVATDAPLSERQLRRLASRATLGLSRSGSIAANGSGELAVAFSVAQRVPHRSDHAYDELRFLRDDSRAMRELYEMAIEATHEAVLGSLCAADAMEGRDGHRLEAFPVGLLEGAGGLVRGPQK